MVAELGYFPLADRFKNAPRHSPGGSHFCRRVNAAPSICAAALTKRQESAAGVNQ
jgi:hypothetical protein